MVARQSWTVEVKFSWLVQFEAFRWLFFLLWVHIDFASLEHHISSEIYIRNINWNSVTNLSEIRMGDHKSSHFLQLS